MAVGYAGAYGDGVGFGVEVDLVELLEGDLVFGAVGDAVERVAGAQGSEFGAAFDYLLDFFDGCGLVEIVGMKGVVSGPVGAGCGGLRVGVDIAGEQGAGDECAGGFEEFSFVHWVILDSVDFVTRLPMRIRYRDLRGAMQALGAGSFGRENRAGTIEVICPTQLCA